jgi:hypothetical protein
MKARVAFGQQGYMAHSREGWLYSATGFFLAPPAIRRVQ